MATSGLYIDGFNLYHGLKSGPKTRRYLWLNLWALGEKILEPGDKLDRVLYFTTIAHFAPGKAKRHQRFIRAVENFGVQTIYGRFEENPRECKAVCRKAYMGWDEKRTDVNLATRVLTDSIGGDIEKVYILTGDSDQIPTIQAIRRLAPKVSVVPVFAPRRHSNDLARAAGRAGIDVGWATFRDCQLPNPVTPRPGVTIRCPEKWLTGEEYADDEE